MARPGFLRLCAVQRWDPWVWPTSLGQSIKEPQMGGQGLPLWGDRSWGSHTVRGHRPGWGTLPQPVHEFCARGSSILYNREVICKLTITPTHKMDAPMWLKVAAPMWTQDSWQGRALVGDQATR
uniref:Uncharacterized protein n=1 Tax=Myotis myotis TaxID=51298 RepID=A0A7J7V3U1_MYOMY|nr:hypothetical protein mMyoMyo1_008471 [Myotis myotis]